MFRTLGAAALIVTAASLPLQQAAAQDAIGGAIFGGAAGAIIGGAAGGGRGAAIGGVIGAAAGAMIAAEGERRRGGYYYYQQGCYLQRPDGYWVRVAPRYCAPVAVIAPSPAGDAAAYCAQRFRSYDPVSQTYVGRDGLRRPCP